MSARTPTAGSTLLMAAGPSLDLRPQPQHRTAAAKVDDWPRHVLVAGLVLANGVAVGETEDLRHVAGIDQIVD